MRKLIITFMVMLVGAMSASAATLPTEIVGYIKKEQPAAEIRFDGLITIRDNLYLPLFPAKIIKPNKIVVKKSVPANKTLKDMPDILVLNNDFVLLKVIEKDGKRSVLYQSDPFLEVKTGLLPQDLLVPKNLTVPENIKGIIGGLRITTEQDVLKVKSEYTKEEKTVHSEVKKDVVSAIPQLRNKNMYIITCHSKNVHVVPAGSSRPEYALSLNSIPIDMKVYQNRFLMVTTYDINAMNVISLADEAVIKCFEFDAQPEEIVIDEINKLAYVSTPSTSSIYVIDLNKMQMKQKIQVNGRCTKLTLADKATKIIYVDQTTNDVWCVELDNDYTIKEVGIFPNVSAIAYSQNKIYLASRTKNRVVIVDYATMILADEFEVSPKPVDMFVYFNNLYILSAENSVVQVLNTQTDKITAIIKLNTNGFSTKIYKVPNTNLAIITDAKAGKYSVLNLDRKQVIKTLPMDIPVSELAVTNKVKKI